MFHIFVVSDGTGRTAQQALNAALMQFPEVNIEFYRRPEVRKKDQVNAVVKEARSLGGFIVHTLVQDEIRHAMIREGRKNNVETIDLMGPLLSRLSHQFANSPSGKPGIFHHLNKEYFERIDAMQFAFHHDDGMRDHELHKAEIVLIGVSRTFKTPLSIYLAFKGWFVANVPVVLGMAPPDMLFEVPAERVFCLTSNPHHLSTLRKFRTELLGGATGSYADFEFVRKEVLYAQNIYNTHPRWSKIKVTSKPIEEIASEILAIRGTDDRRKSTGIES
ncbi:MAG: kinase/pyrophosphorylase [Bacteroidales bacterium]|nr:kinase/pyrophosphorylase [Bacteroidales bacterium]MCF8387271.1 kinase/pyrophosphorylase [Bacteroidales bacterium]MCF8396883.1 kinase/pyrophosphorylase [Bacteroidales bacterium]